MKIPETDEEIREMCKEHKIDYDWLMDQGKRLTEPVHAERDAEAIRRLTHEITGNTAASPFTFRMRY